MQASAHWICSVGNSFSFSVDISTISTSINPCSNGMVWRYSKSVFERYSPINRRVRYRTVSAENKKKNKRFSIWRTLFWLTKTWRFWLLFLSNFSRMMMRISPVRQTIYRRKHASLIFNESERLRGWHVTEFLKYHR